MICAGLSFLVRRSPITFAVALLLTLTVALIEVPPAAQPRVPLFAAAA